MRNPRDDPDARRRQLALFRFGIIGDLDVEALPRGERSARIVELAARPYRTPDGRERRFSARTLWAWWSAYAAAGNRRAASPAPPRSRHPQGLLAGAARSLHRLAARAAVALHPHAHRHPRDAGPRRPRTAASRDARSPPRGCRRRAPPPQAPRRQALHPFALPAPEPALGRRLPREHRRDKGHLPGAPAPSPASPVTDRPGSAGSRTPRPGTAGPRTLHDTPLRH
jgi:hypothetical protein